MKLYTPAFAALYLTNLLIVASFAGYFLFPLYVTAHGGGEAEIGLLMGSFALASAACRPWISEMIDRIGRKRSYTVGSVVMTLAPFCYLPFHGQLASFFWPLLLLRVVHGIGLAICFTAVFTFIVDLIPEGRLNEGIGMFGTSGLVGLALGPACAELLIRLGDFAALFVGTALLAALGLLLHLPVREISRQPAEHTPGPGFFTLLCQRKHLLIALLAGLFGIAIAATSTFVAPLVEQRRLGVISSYYLAYSSTAVGIRFVAGRLADRRGEARLLPWGILLAVGGIFLLPFCNGQTLLIASGLLSGAGHGLIFPSLNALAIRGEAYAVRGKITGIFTGSIDGGTFAGALVLGLIGDRFGYTTLFLCAGLVLMSGLWLLRYRPAT